MLISIETHITCDFPGEGSALRISGGMFVCLIWFFTSHQQSLSYKGTGLPGLNQY